MSKYKRGFTVVEIIFVAVLLGFASIVFFLQKSNIETIARDEQKKTAINAMYYSLEEVFYKTNNYYPETIDSTILPSVDPELFKDPNGITIGDNESSYSYDALNCQEGKCASYNLSTTLENESDYAKSSLNK